MLHTRDSMRNQKLIRFLCIFEMQCITRKFYTLFILLGDLILYSESKLHVFHLSDRWFC